VLSVKLTRKNRQHSWFYRKTEPFFQAMESGYRNSLGAFMQVRWVALVILFACLTVVYFISRNIQSELAPMEDRSQFRLQLRAAEGTSFDYMDAFVQRTVDFVMDSVPEYTTALSVTAPGFTGGGAVNNGFVRVRLVDPELRERSQSEIVAMVNRNLHRGSDDSGKPKRRNAGAVCDPKQQFR
jgi:multidrug efflux pump subunit AcrB